MIVASLMLTFTPIWSFSSLHDTNAKLLRATARRQVANLMTAEKHYLVMAIVSKFNDRNLHVD